MEQEPVGDTKTAIMPPHEVSFMLNAAMSPEPKTFEEAVRSLDLGKWLEAMDSEIKSFEKNEVFELITLPAGRKTSHLQMDL